MFAKRNIFLTYLSLQRINHRDGIDHSLSIWNGCIQKQYRTRKKRINNKRTTATYTPLLYNSKYNYTILLSCTDLFCLRMATSMFHGKSTALEVVQGLNVKLDGKVLLITGATSDVIISLHPVSTFSSIIITRYPVTKYSLPHRIRYSHPPRQVITPADIDSCVL